PYVQRPRRGRSGRTQQLAICSAGSVVHRFAFAREQISCHARHVSRARRVKRARRAWLVVERGVVVVGCLAAEVGEAEEEAAEVGHGAGDAECARVAVAVLLRGAPEQGLERRLAQELGPHGEALAGATLLADAHRHVPLRHPRAPAEPPRAEERGGRRRSCRGGGLRGSVGPERLVGGGSAGVGRGHAGEPSEQALHRAAASVDAGDLETLVSGGGGGFLARV
uniref:Uncharacterized protein n=1 Tax=Triticum urartu TaxID=4572 RepID=A0A8R7VCI5_TRIUA